MLAAYGHIVRTELSRILIREIIVKTQSLVHVLQPLSLHRVIDQGIKV